MTILQEPPQRGEGGDDSLPTLAGMRLISGSPAALRTTFAERVYELRRHDPLAPIYVLVGTSLQRPHLERWLAARLGGHANVRILMPGDLALLLGAPALVLGERRALPPLADRVLLADVAGVHPGYFAPVAMTPGFGEALYRLVRELKGAGYDVSALASVLEGATDAPEKADALAQILADFEARRTRFYGPDDALAAAEPERLTGLGLLVWGIIDLPPALERLVAGIADWLPVDVFLPDVPAAADAPLGALRERMLADGAELHPVSEPAEDQCALAIIRRRIFTLPGPARLDADGTIRLVSAPDPAREVRAAARACLAWAQDGVPFWEMAVAYRHGEAYRPLVEAVFIECGIPLYLHEGSPLAERPIGRQTLALLDLYDSELSRQSVMDFLTDARLSSELHDDFGGVPAARWDSVSRQAGIVGGAEQWAQRLQTLQTELAGNGTDADADPPKWVQDRIDDAGELARFIADLNARLQAHPGRAPWANHLNFLADLLARYVDGGQEIVKALRGLERFTALEAEVGFDRFLDVVRRAVKTLRSEDVLQGRAGAFARRGVNVVAVNSLPGIEFLRIWILGASERAFPPPARQDPILLDGERAAISERSGGPLAPRAARGTEEALQFTLACEAARERLVVSYARRATGESRPRLPSVFFRELASQLEGERVSAERAPLLPRVDVERIPGDAIGAPILGGRLANDSAVDKAAAGAASVPERERTYLQANVTRPLASATFERAEPAFARALAASQARRSSSYSEWDGALSPAALSAVAKLVPPARVFSPTALESYASCPQRFLMRDVLRIRAVQEPERSFRIDALRRGNLFHRILQRFHDDWHGAGSASLASEAGERMRSIAEAECDAARARGETGYPAMWAIDRLEVIDDCLRWLELESEDSRTVTLPMGACEARFGPRYSGEQVGALSRDEPIEIVLDGGKLSLSGRIDRITWDHADSRFRVIDYKTGKVRDERSAQLQGGRMLQLPLYVLAGAQLLGIDPSGGEAAYVYPTRRGEFKTVEWTGGELAERHDEVLSVLNGVLDGIARGDFMVAPYDEKKACTYCDFNSICPTGRGPYVKRKQGDERLTSFSEQIRNVP